MCGRSTSTACGRTARQWGQGADFQSTVASSEPIGGSALATGSTTITVDGVQIGTPLYMAPEQVRYLFETTTRPEGHELEPPRSRGRSLRVSRSYCFETTTRPEGHELEPPRSRGRSLRVSRLYCFETTTRPEGHELEPPRSRGRSLRVSRSYCFETTTGGAVI